MIEFKSRNYMSTQTSRRILIISKYENGREDYTKEK